MYNVENYLLIGNVSLNRDKNKQVSQFDLTEDVEFLLDDRTITAKAISNVDNLNASSEITVVMRMHFLVNTFLNMYITNLDN